MTGKLIAWAAALAVAGCADPYDWPHHWNASQVNQLNLAAQATDWRDLAVGHGDPGADGQEAAAAVERLRQGKVKPIASASVSDLASQAAPEAAPVSNAGPAAATPAAN